MIFPMNTSPAGETALEPREIVQRWRSSLSPVAPVPTDMTARLEPLAGIRGVIFDLYGTLFVSAAGEIGHAAGDHEDCLRAVLRRYHLPVRGDAGDCCTTAVWRDCIVRSHAAGRARGIVHPEIEIRDIWRESLEIMDHEGLLEHPAVEDATVERIALAYEAAVNPVWPMPDARRMIVGLRNQGLRLGIVSNAQFFTPFLFDALMDAPSQELGFDTRLCVWSYRMGEAKPSLRLFEYLLENAAGLDIRHPSELLYVGNDMLNDVYAAHQAGLRTALFAGDRRSLRLRDEIPRCRDLQPDVVLTGLMDLRCVVPD